MSTRFLIPRILSRYCQGKMELELNGVTVGELLADLQERFPDLHGCLRHENGKIRPHINLFVNNNFLRFLNGLETPLEPGDVVSVFQAVSGG